MKSLNVTGAGRNVYNDSGAKRYVRRTVEVTFMRIGKCELSILGILANNDGKISFREVKEQLSGHSQLKWRRMGYDTHHKTSVKHKAIVRATKTLEEKGLILRRGHLGYDKQFTSIFRLELTNKGQEEYLKRIGEIK